MSSEALRQGVSRIVLRTAAYYAALGIGTYRPPGHAHFDRVEVVVVQPFEIREMLSHSGAILRVEFWRETAMVRYVDFVLAVAGFSGKPLVAAVP